MDTQKQEVREAIELPLLQHHLYTQIGIDPPRGVLLYGPPGTGKTMMAKAVANATSATFISMVGSEFVQKYLGEGPRMVRDVFRLARENSPCVVFIDEIDAIATKRFDAQTGADREVQRILLELLNQMDGFDQSTNVKVIMATNRADTLDPALLRPGRLDRKIEFPNPDRRQKRMVFQAATSKMNLSDDLDLEDYVNRSEKVRPSRHVFTQPRPQTNVTLLSRSLFLSARYPAPTSRPSAPRLASRPSGRTGMSCCQRTSTRRTRRQSATTTGSTHSTLCELVGRGKKKKKASLECII